MERRSARTSVAALSIFVAASLTMPAAYATPALNSAASAADTSAQVMCVAPGTHERLAKAVEEARAGGTLAEKNLATAQKSLDEQSAAAQTSAQKAAQSREAVAAALAALQDADRRAEQDAFNELAALKQSENALRADIQKAEAQLAEIDTQLA